MFSCNDIKIELLQLVKTCNTYHYKNSASIEALKALYKQVIQTQKGIAYTYNDFPVITRLEDTFLLIDKSLQQTNKQKQEWIFDHCADLFKFFVESLLLNIDIYMNHHQHISQANIQNINT